MSASSFLTMLLHATSVTGTPLGTILPRIPPLAGSGALHEIKYNTNM